MIKDIKKIDVLTLLQPAEANGLKGYMFIDDVDSHSDINSGKWSATGRCRIYFLDHPTHPKLTLIVSSEIYGNKITIVDDIDSFLKTIINSIKK